MSGAHRAPRLATRLWARARRRLSADDGFILLESMIAISLITVIMAAIGVEFVSGLASTNRQRATQVATELAGSAIDQIRALSPTDLVTGRDAGSVSAEFATGNAIALVAPWLQSMDQISDPKAATGAGATATIPTSPVTQKPGSISYAVTQYIGTCQLITTAAGSNCVPAAQVPSSQTTAVQYLRAVVAVGWSNPTCGSVGCNYVASTLISNTPDPTFRINQAAAATPVINPPGDQKSEIGDSPALQLSLQTGTGVPALNWQITSGSPPNGTLPNGLSIDPSSGLISGTVTGPTGSQSVTVQVTDAYGRTASTTFVWGVFPGPTITAPPNQKTPINTAVNLAVTTTCANTPCTYAMTNAPAGLSISNTGVITGTPTTAGTQTVTVTVTDANLVKQTTAPFTWTVVAPVSTCPTAVSLPNGSFEAPVVSAGAGHNVGNGTSGLAWRTNDANGQVELWANGGNSTSQNSGTAISAQDGTQWVEVDGADLDTLYQDLSTTPGQVLQWSIWHRARNVYSNPSGRDVVQVQMGSTSSQSAQVPSSSTAAGISDDSSAWVNYTGTYTVPAGQTTTRFQVAAISTSSGQAGAGNFLDNVTVTGTPCLSSAPSTQTSTLNTAISPLQLTAAQGSGSYAWSGGASLPAGLSLSSGGLITGTPTATGGTPVALTLTDTKSGYQQSLSFTWNVTAAPTLTTSNQTSTVNNPVSVSPSATCPNSPCTYAMTGQPSGLSIGQSSGTITGTPTAVGTSNPVAVTITDRSGASATSSFTWVVKAAPTIATPGNQNTTVGANVNLAVGSTCANSACTYSFTAAPAGLNINSSTGTITGTPTTAGTSSAVRVTVTDQAGATASTAAFTWTVYAAPTLASPGNQAATVNTAVIVRNSSTCANTPCTWTMSGAPSGLSINNSTGTITGTPTSTGTSNSVRVTITDNSGVTASTTFTWTVYSAPTVTAPANQSTQNNAAVNLSLTTTCPNSPCAYALNGGPAGLTVTSAGTITGTVTSAKQTFSGVTITVTDSSGATATSAGFNWAVTTPQVGRWTFDESSGSTAADSAGSHPATLSGAYARTTTAAQGANAVSFNGSSGTYATTSAPVLNTANSFTVSVWAKLASTSDYSTFAAQSGTNVSGFYLQYNPNSNRFRFYKLSSDSTSSGGAAQNALAAPVIGQWYQLTGVYDATAGTVSLFVNGVRQGAPVTAPGGFNATGNFTMGAGTFGGLTNWANGGVDDVRAYSSALSDDAVAQLAQAGYWALDEGTGTTAADSSLNGGTGTLSGGTSWAPGIVGPSAVAFNGSNGVITSNSTVIDTSQSFTVSAWAKPSASSASSYGILASVDGTNVSGFALIQYGTNWGLTRPASDSSSAAVTTVTSSSTIVAGQWYLVSGVYDSVAQTLTLYVNGVKQGSVAYSTGWKATGSFIIGRGKSSGAAYLNYAGTIDDVHAFQFAADQATISSLGTLTPAAPATPTASATNSGATVSWTAPPDVNGSPVTGYVVTPYLDGVAQSAVTYNTTATSQPLTGLATGGSYTFTVRAVNANGSSKQSGQSAAVMPT